LVRILPCHGYIFPMSLCWAYTMSMFISQSRLQIYHVYMYNVPVSNMNVLIYV